MDFLIKNPLDNQLHLLNYLVWNLSLVQVTGIYSTITAAFHSSRFFSLNKREFSLIKDSKSAFIVKLNKNREDTFLELITFGGIIGYLFSLLLPLLIVAFFIRWVRLLKINSDKQVEQSKEIIELLRSLNEKLKIED